MSLEHSATRQKQSTRESVLPDPLPPLLRVREAAQYLRVSTRHVMKLVGDGRLEVVEFGNRCKRISTASVVALVEKHRIVQTQTAAS